MEFFIDLQYRSNCIEHENGSVEKQRGGIFEASDLFGFDQSVEVRTSSFVQDHGELIEVHFVSQDDLEFHLKSKDGKWFLRRKQEPIEVVIH